MHVRIRMRKRKRTNELLLELIFKEQTKAIDVAGQAPQAQLRWGKPQVTGDLAVGMVSGTKVGDHLLTLATHHSTTHWRGIQGK